MYKKNTARSGTRFGRSWCQIWTIVGDGGETFFKFCHPGAEYVGHIWCHQNSIFVISPEFWKILKIEHKKIWKVMEKIWTHGKMYDIFDAWRGLLLLLSNPSNLVVDPVVCDIYNIWVQYFLFSPKIKRIFFKFLKEEVEFPRTVVVDYISIMPTSSVGRPREGVN